MKLLHRLRDKLDELSTHHPKIATFLAFIFVLVWVLGVPSLIACISANTPSPNANYTDEETQAESSYSEGYEDGYIDGYKDALAGLESKIDFYEEDKD